MRFLFVDRILPSDSKQIVRGVKHVTADDFYLTRNDEGQVVFMPSLIGETLGQLAAWRVMSENDFSLRPVAGVVASATSHRPVPVGSTILLESVIEAVDESAVQYHSTAWVEDEPVFSIEGALGPMLPMTDFIDVDVVRQQYNEVAQRPDTLVGFDFDKTIPLVPDTLKPFAFQFDQITSFQSGESLQATKKITRAAPYFDDHFPKKPVLPMTVLLESKINLAKIFIAKSQFDKAYQFQQMRRIKMNAFVQPGEVVQTTLKVKSVDADTLVLVFRSDVAGKRVCVLEMILTARG